MFAVPVRAATVAAALLAATCAFAGGPGSTSGGAPLVELTINPTTVAAGGTISVTGSVTNTSKKSQAFTATYTITGPCSYSDEETASFKLGSLQTRTASVNYTAPACPGIYTVFGTVTSGSGTASATASFTVF